MRSLSFHVSKMIEFQGTNSFLASMAANKGNITIMSFPDGNPESALVVESIGIPESAPVRLVPGDAPTGVIIRGRKQFDSMHWNESDRTLHYDRSDPNHGPEGGFTIVSCRRLRNINIMETTSVMTKVKTGETVTARAVHKRA